MTTNAPASRKTHIIRIIGRNRAGDRLTDIWADVERMDVIKSAMQIPPHHQWQGVQRILRWGDDPDSDGYFPDGVPSRIYEVVKVCDPQTQDPDDPDEWIPIRVIRGMRSRGGGSELQGQGWMDRFVRLVTNVQLTSSRTVDVRKISHYDTNIDDDAQAAFDADQDRRVYVVSADEYEKDLDSKDEGQFIDHEIITALKHKTNNLEIMGLGRQTKLRNEYQIDESDPADGNVIGENGFNPPYRLDPFQNIVNIQLAPTKIPLIGLGHSSFAHVASNDDGATWATQFSPSQVTNGASGFGRTVVRTGRNFVAFGKPQDGESCFIAAGQSGVIQRGTIRDGELEWKAIGSVPNDLVLSCHFVNGVFFIGYLRFDQDKSLFAVSFDGKTFTPGVDPFPGVQTRANGTGVTGVEAGPRGGSIAYDGDRGLYVTVGSYQRTYAEVIDVGAGPVLVQNDDINLMSSTSSDGISWSPTFDTSEVGVQSGYGGVGKIGGPNFYSGYCVAFGNGRFVACAHRKSGVKTGPFALFVAKGNGTATAIVSTNGVSWSDVLLPGQPTPSNTLLSASGTVMFVRKKGLGPGIDGYFLMTSEVTENSSVLRDCMIHYSLDGTNWARVAGTAARGGFVATLVNKNARKIVNL